jgi:Ca2+-binding RTX toxin-like protein
VALGSGAILAITVAPVLAALILGTSGPDYLLGTTGADEMRGYQGADRIYGRAGNDLINGGPGRDRIVGGRGLDSLRGGAGGDRIVGGPQADFVSGGPGDDIIRVDDDSRPDRVFCGDDLDTVYYYVNDSLSSDCESQIFKGTPVQSPSPIQGP